MFDGVYKCLFSVAFDVEKETKRIIEHGFNLINTKVRLNIICFKMD